MAKGKTAGGQDHTAGYAGRMNPRQFVAFIQAERAKFSELSARVQALTARVAQLEAAADGRGRGVDPTSTPIGGADPSGPVEGDPRDPGRN